MNALILALALALAGQNPPVGSTAEHTPDERLAFMKASARIYAIAAEGVPPGSITHREDPAFRAGRQGSVGVQEGAVFLWADGVGRPAVAAQIFLERTATRPAGKWVHEFTSLGTAPLVVTRDGEPRWSPSAAGVEFQPVPGAPKPAATAAARLRQMRAIAAEFRAEDNFGDLGWGVLRMLVRPIARYGRAGAVPEDGALFAFVEGTDPEVFLFVEARPGTAGLEWQYALAPMTCFAVKATFQGREVWSLGRRATDIPSRPFFSYEYRP